MGGFDDVQDLTGLAFSRKPTSKNECSLVREEEIAHASCLQDAKVRKFRMSIRLVSASWLHSMLYDVSDCTIPSVPNAQ